MATRFGLPSAEAVLLQLQLLLLLLLLLLLFPPALLLVCLSDLLWIDSCC
jgi:hypothetical protein